MKDFKNIMNRISSWMYWNSPIYINSLNFNNLFREWRKVKKYFVKPKYVFVGKSKTTSWYKHIFRFEINPLEWKTKYNDYRHEANPCVKLTLFGYTWKWEVAPQKCDGEDVSLQFYETVLSLDYALYKDKFKCTSAETLYKVISANTWVNCDTNKEINCANNLTTYGRHLYDAMKHSKMNNAGLNDLEDINERTAGIEEEYTEDDREPYIGPEIEHVNEEDVAVDECEVDVDAGKDMIADNIANNKKFKKSYKNKKNTTKQKKEKSAKQSVDTKQPANTKQPTKQPAKSKSSNKKARNNKKQKAK